MTRRTHDRLLLPSRRRFVRSLAAAGFVAGTWPARADAPRSPLAWCDSGPEPLRIPGTSGWFGRFSPAGKPFALRAATLAQRDTMPWSDGYACEHEGRVLLNPTLVVESGERLRVEFVNALGQPSIVHWHGLANDTLNDGGGQVLAVPSSRYAYDFVVRDRAGLYWYHPHPHGLTAQQMYRGLFGLIEVLDDEERALRRALDFRPGQTEFTLVLQDRGPTDYAIDALDRHRGLLGDVATVNGCIGPVHEVATRAYRYRILNASNARTFQLGFRTASGTALAFTLIGTDGGLLREPIRCNACYLSPAERIDVVVDLRAASPGETVVLESRRFDPMHVRLPDEAPPAASAQPGHHGADEPRLSTARRHDGWPEGAPRDLMTIRVRERVTYRATIPHRLSGWRPLETEGARERPFRLGYNKGRWRINDLVFKMGETPIEVSRDATEIWLLRNYHTSMPHAMHLHGFHFQVLERETSPDFLAALATEPAGRLATDLGWKDTVLVWPGESVRIAVRFAMPYAGAQTYMFHCHNLEHEDGGMMLGVKVA